MADCTPLITSGILKNCDTVNAAIGQDKDLILVNYDEFDRALTLLIANREVADTNNNEGGLTNIELKTGAVQHIFEGTDYSVIPTITPEIKEDGDLWYLHSLLFTVYSKRAKDRKTIESLGGSKVVAITIERSTGLYEIFGIDQGLKVSTIERAYIGAQNSNFYNVTLSTPEIAIMRESTLGELAVSINTAI